MNLKYCTLYSKRKQQNVLQYFAKMEQAIFFLCDVKRWKFCLKEPTHSGINLITHLTVFFVTMHDDDGGTGHHIAAVKEEKNSSF